MTNKKDRDSNERDAGTDQSAPRDIEQSEGQNVPQSKTESGQSARSPASTESESRLSTIKYTGKEYRTTDSLDSPAQLTSHFHTVSLQALRPHITVGDSTTLSAGILPRVPRATYKWTITSPSWVKEEQEGPLDTFQFQPSAAGMYTIRVDCFSGTTDFGYAEAQIEVATASKKSPEQTVLEGAEQILLRFKQNLDEKFDQMGDRQERIAEHMASARAAERNVTSQAPHENRPLRVALVNPASETGSSGWVSDVILWYMIRSASARLSFNKIHAEVIRRLKADGASDTVFGVHSYSRLFEVTEKVVLESALGAGDAEEIQRAIDGNNLTQEQIAQAIDDYETPRDLDYLDVDRITPTNAGDARRVRGDWADHQDVIRRRITGPLYIELIWSYYHELGSLVQTIKAVSLRFQNKSAGGSSDALSRFEVDSLRPINNLLWGYIQREDDQLTINRRVHEYEHHYGIGLTGSAIGRLRPSERRSQFLEAFHAMLRQCVLLFRELDDNTLAPDGFPVLNALRGVHLQLREGMHNQYGDLPWVARVEMTVEQILLARPEMHEFLGGRRRMPYTEEWMDRVDTMKRIQNWSDVSITEFNRLAVWGEQLLLTIRFGNWADPATTAAAALSWAAFWRPAIQGYIHTYRTVTGVDLTAASVASSLDSVSPSVHLARRSLRQANTVR
jgi:hypothetical protein